MSQSSSRHIVKWIVLIFTPIIYYQCYMYVGFNQNYTKMLLFATSAILIVKYLKDLLFKKYERDSYSNFFKRYFIVILISYLMALVVWDQLPHYTFRAENTIFVMLYYFILKQYKVDEKDLNKIICIFATIYAILWLYALTQAPRVVFGNLESLNDNRGFYRITMLKGLDFLALFYFYSLYKTVIQKNRNIIWTILCIASYILIVLSLTRTLILASTFITVVLILRRRPVLAFILGVILSFGGLNLISQNKVVSSMMDLTESQQDNANKDELVIRNEEYSLYLELFPLHPLTTTFGNGPAHRQTSYGEFENRNKEIYKFHRDDAGYICILTTFGVVGLLLFLWLLRKVYRQKVPDNYLQYKLFVFYLFIINYTAQYCIYYGAALTLSIYALELARVKSKQQNQLK